jgi:hypothetical protein
MFGATCNGIPGFICPFDFGGLHGFGESKLFPNYFHFTI